VPIYGSALSLALARNRIDEAGMLDRTDFITVADGERRRIGPIDCQFIPVTHSVPEGFAIAFFTPAGTIIHTGDFKLDLTPVDGRRTDLALLGELARRDGGVRLLLSDSTNAERPGFTPSESTVGAAMRSLFREHADKRFIVTSFASHLHRVEQVAQAAIAHGRKVAFVGRSMEQNTAMARERGVIDIPAYAVLDIEETARYAPGDVCIICTGSQGEPMSALSLMAAHEHKYVKVSPDDVVVISAHAIPGNESNVSRVIDSLHRAGAEVVHDRTSPVHVSGHASQEELKFVLNLVSPEWFVPVHGEYRHLLGHARLAGTVGLDPERIFVVEDGTGIEVTPTTARIVPGYPTGRVLVDGKGIGDIGAVVLRDRQILAEDGVIAVAVTFDHGTLVAGPDVASRGVVYVRENEAFLDDIRAAVRNALAERDRDDAWERDAIVARIRTAVRQLVNQRVQRKPIVLPIILEV
jgi:ribonuclease J